MEVDSAITSSYNHIKKVAQRRLGFSILALKLVHIVKKPIKLLVNSCFSSFLVSNLNYSHELLQKQNNTHKETGRDNKISDSFNIDQMTQTFYN